MKDDHEPIYDPYKKKYSGTEILKGVLSVILGFFLFLFGFFYIGTGLVILYCTVFSYTTSFSSDSLLISDISSMLDSPITWILYYIGGSITAHLMGIWGLNRAPSVYKYTSVMLGIILILYYLVNLILHLIFNGSFIYCFFGVASGILYILQGVFDKFSKPQ